MVDSSDFEIRFGRLADRLSRVEQEQAAERQRLEDISRTIDRLIPHGETLVGVTRDITALREAFATIQATLREGERKRDDAKEQRDAERRSDRRLLWGVIGTVIASTIAALGGILAAGIHP